MLVIRNARTAGNETRKMGRTKIKRTWRSTCVKSTKGPAVLKNTITWQVTSQKFPYCMLAMEQEEKETDVGCPKKKL